MRTTIERKIMTAFGTAVFFIATISFIFYQNTARFLEKANQMSAAMDRQSATGDALLAMEGLDRGIKQEVWRIRWVGGTAVLFSALFIAASCVAIHRGFRTRRRAEDQLRENEERFGLLVERAREYAIFRLDVEGRVQSWNAGAQRIKGYEADEIIGEHFSVFYLPEAVLFGQPGVELQTALEKGQYQSDGWRLRKDGSCFWGNVVITPLRDGRGDHVGFSEVFRDLSDQKRAEQAIAELNKTLQRQNLWLVAANGEMEAFSYSVSHDLRAPLRSLSGFSEAILEDYGHKMDPECQSLLNRILVASQRMGQLIDGLLDLSRVTRVDMRLESVDMTTIARDIAAELKRDGPERSVHFAIADGLVAEGDPCLLRILLTNLLGNAWKFTAGHPLAKIEFGSCAVEGGRAFFVRDNGVGFDMTYSSKLFRTFQRLHASTEFAGTGIGLATVNRIVHRYGGRVWGQGKIDEGAVFYFSLQPVTESSIDPRLGENPNLTTKELRYVA
jgi:PAS domain S-box-containing protein